ncbi:hypothetical protein Q8A67_011348 [Cirrhinus molitorella]|uniref:Uncharacterized protein n=1 Tax=Cirrhinus molitorella TaxID=172907 RepID=A0AA88PQI1_9TELE|nr:hypothetical protein Q8A67_011348 [Cirrhinus molitorella]
MSASLVTRDEISQSPTPCSYAKTAEDIKSSAQDFQKLRPSREQEVKGFHCDVSDREIDRGKDGESGILSVAKPSCCENISSPST